jgi:hypothetical protein
MTHKRKKNHGKTRKRVQNNGDKKWITALSAAKTTLKNTGSLSKAKKALIKQALFNARKLFGSVGK